MVFDGVRFGLRYSAVVRLFKRRYGILSILSRARAEYYVYLCRPGDAVRLAPHNFSNQSLFSTLLRARLRGRRRRRPKKHFASPRELARKKTRE